MKNGMTCYEILRKVGLKKYAFWTELPNRMKKLFIWVFQKDLVQFFIYITVFVHMYWRKPNKKTNSFCYKKW